MKGKKATCLISLLTQIPPQQRAPSEPLRGKEGRASEWRLQIS